uniref:NHL repeat-containing protein 2 n=1 Tax=Macrostomum lignano TaxID=282301 RepID=A0A1I8G8N4_9PLAT
YANQAAHLSPVVSEASKPIDDVEAGRLAAAGLAAANRHRLLMDYREPSAATVLNRRYPLLHRDPADCLRYVQPMPVAANAHLLMGAIVYNRQMSKLRQQQPSTGSNNNYNSHAASTVGDKNNNNTNVQSFNLNRRQSDILVADGLGGCVRAFKLTTGCQAYCLGGGGGARCQQDQLKCPELVAVHRATGNIVICDTDQASIRLLLYAFGGRTQLKVFGADAELRAPRALCFDKDGRVLVLDGRSKRRSLGIRDQDAKQFRAVLFNPGCQLLTNFICAQLFEPTGVAVDAVYRLYVSDYCGGCVMVYNYIGDLLSKLGGPGITDQPCGVAVRHTDGAIVVVGSAVLKRPTSSSTAGCYCAILTVLAADSAPSIGVTAGALLKSIELELGTFCKCRKFALSESGHLALLGDL